MTQRTAVRAGGAAAAALLLASCIGTISREDFDEEIRSRGGGMSERDVLDVVRDLEARLDTDDVRVRTFSANPSSGEIIVVVEARDPAEPRNLDRFVYDGDDLRSTEPVQVSASEDLDAETYPLAAFALDELDEMVDEALLAYDAEGGYIDGMRLAQQTRSIDGSVAPELVVQIDLESPRSTAVATFTAEGELLGVEIR